MPLIDTYNDGYDAAEDAMENHPKISELAGEMRAKTHHIDALDLFEEDTRASRLQNKVPRLPEQASAFTKGAVDALLEKPRHEELKGALGKFD